MKREAKPRVCFHRPMTRQAGISYGYWHLVQNVAAAVEHDPDSPVALHCNPPENFRPIPGKTNVLLTMWESRDFPREDLVHLRGADVLLVPSTFCVKVFERIASCPVYLLPLGVDVDVFAYRRRKKPARTKDDPFVWLWCASSDPRKGWSLIARAWQLAFAGCDDVLLYMKTSGMDAPKLERKGNAIFDSRNLSPDEYRGLFERAHGFLYPSMGEGFGLTAAEAMSSGLPVVGTSWSGHADFVHTATAWPVVHELQRAQALTDRESDAKDGRFEIAVPDPVDIIRQMHRVMADPATATAKAQRAAALMRSRYSWAGFRRNLASVLGRVEHGIPTVRAACPTISGPGLAG